MTHRSLQHVAVFGIGVAFGARLISSGMATDVTSYTGLSLLFGALLMEYVLLYRSDGTNTETVK